MSKSLKDKPLVSVVMSFHNGGETLAHALRSILWQTYDNWELILINDGSTDNAEQIARSFGDPRIRLYGDSMRRGLPARLNQGVSLAQGEYIARMDADDIAFPERFFHQVMYLQMHPEVDLLATAALVVDAEHRAIGLLSAGLSHEEISIRPWQGFPMPHPTWMGRAAWFRQNRYDERAYLVEDQALLYHTYKKSHFARLPDVLLAYRYDRLSARKTMFAHYNYLRTLAAGGDKKHLLAGTAIHVGVALRDLTAILLKMDSRVIKSGLKSADESLLKYWVNLARSLSPSG